MITDNFVVLTHNVDTDNPVMHLRCKKCQHEFEAQLNILKPKNCKHELGQATTIICPSCASEGTTTVAEDKLASLKNVASMLEARVKGYFEQHPAKFKALGPMNPENSSMPVQCIECNFQFMVGIMGRVNCAFVNHNLTIRCPQCGIAELITREAAIERVELLAAILRLEISQQQIAQLEGGNNVPNV